MEQVEAEPERVPERYVGAWQRLILQLDDVAADVTSQAFRLQTRAWHADIHLPAPRPAFADGAALSDYGETALRWLATQHGCAGLTEVDGEDDICHWHRVADFQPPTGAPTLGEMVLIEPGMLIETRKHARHLEIWQKLPDGDGITRVLQRADADAPAQWLLVAGGFFMHVRARRGGTLPLAESLADLIEDRRMSVEQMRDILDFEISFGRHDTATWRIEHSTLPFLEGTRLLEAPLPAAPEGSDTTLVLRGTQTRWRVLESIG